MSRTAAVLRSSWAIHGLGVSVCSDEPAVIDAMELRFRGFRSAPNCQPDVRFEFVRGLPAPSPLSGHGRPVYDTPYGSLQYYSEADALWGELAGVSLHCEPALGTAVLRAETFAGTALYLATHPLATISLMELLERRGLFSLHAACLCDAEGRGVLLAGSSGAGKSTLAVALARDGMHFLSDDVVFLAPREPGRILALGFSDTIGVSDYAAQRFGELRGRLDPVIAGFPKPLGRMEDLCAAQVMGDCEPHALVFPEVMSDRPSQLTPLDPQAALLRLVPDVLLTEPSATQAHLAAIAALLRQVRCYRLVSGHDLEQAAKLVREVI